MNVWMDGTPLDDEHRYLLTMPSDERTLQPHPLAEAEMAEAVNRYGTPVWRAEWTAQGIEVFGPAARDLQRHDAKAIELNCDRCGAWLTLPPVSRYEQPIERSFRGWPRVCCPHCGRQPTCWPDVLLSIARQNLAAWWRDYDGVMAARASTPRGMAVRPCMT